MNHIILFLVSLGTFAISCERSAQNVETPTCDPKKTNCARKSAKDAKADGFDKQSYDPSDKYDDKRRSDDSPQSSNNPESPSNSASNSPDPQFTPNIVPNRPDGGDGNNVPSENQDLNTPRPLQTIDPSLQEVPLGVTALFTTNGDLKINLPPQRARSFTEMTYTIGMGKVPSSPSRVESNGIIDAGPVQVNLQLFFKFEGKTCQSETNIAQGSQVPTAVATRCR